MIQSVAAQVVIRKRRCATSSARLISIRGTFSCYSQTALSYDYLRRYADEAGYVGPRVGDRPNDVGLESLARVGRIRLESRYPTLASTDRCNSGEKSRLQSQRLAEAWLTCALAERDPAAAANALAAWAKTLLAMRLVKYSPRFMEGLIARMTKDDAKARAAFTAARAEQEKLVRAHPDDRGALCVLGLIDAALGRKEEALREGRRAVELLPVEKDAINGTRMISVFG